MPIYRMPISVAMNSTLARDRQIIVPVFNDKGIGTDPQGLVDELHAAFKTWYGLGTSGELTVKCYDVQKHPHGPALATKTINPGTIPGNAYPNEIALCLSFFSEFNLKRRRGRVYVPLNWLSGTPAPAVRPTSAHMNKAAALHQIFEDLGGIDVDWSVYSKVDDAARTVTNWWVDDEWDVQRRRGLRSTSRIMGTTGE